ncbi:hypothetical protein [Pseudonocardia acidicola]|uniref:hypothetical protein n=1 Tax=Pseudonocardia acidicola TaxID=2724939 RepID=UPI001B7CFCBB|nr:hypothetical protein [Pseudonocardia acidicola]
MAVSLPTAADVRKAREQAAKNAAERAEVARTPLLAVLGAGEYAVSTVSRAVTTARTRAAEQADAVQHRVSGLPQEIEGLRDRLNAEELRKRVDELGAQAKEYYAGLAERGEAAWGKLRKQPQVKQALSTIESVTERLDARVDEFVDDAHDAAEKALSTVTRQTRSTGEKAAQATQRLAGEAAQTVTGATADAGKAVAEAGKDAAATIDEAGDEAAATARSTTRKAANRTAPKAATRKPATRRTGTTNGSGSNS